MNTEDSSTKQQFFQDYVIISRKIVSIILKDKFIMRCLMKCDDTDLIQRTLEGDEQAFSELVEKYQMQIHALTWQKIGDFHIAQEITQDVFLKAYQKLSSLKHHSRFSGWLYVIADHKCKNWFRKRKLSLKSLEDVDPTELEEVYYSEYMTHQREEAANSKRRAIVQKLLSKLQESERTVVNLYYIADMTCEEIGKFLGVSPNAVRTRLHRARERLKKEESVIKENLSSFKLPKQFTDNTMQKISESQPITPTISKPLAPLAISAASAIIVFMLLGVGVQQFPRLQQPYSLNAQTEQTVEIVDTPIVLKSPEKPTVPNKSVSSQNSGNSNGIGKKLDASLFGVAHADEGDTPAFKNHWVPTKGPEGGPVPTLYKTTRGDIYAGTTHGLYRLTDDHAMWQRISKIRGPSDNAINNNIDWWPITERKDTLFIAMDKEIIKSTDRGETWTTLCNCRKGKLVGIVIADGLPDTETDMTIYLAFTDGVFKTTDAGETWTQLSEGIKNRKIQAIASIDNTVFAGTDKGLFSLNSEKWVKQTFQSIFALATSGKNLYVLTGKKSSVTVKSDKYTMRYEMKVPKGPGDNDQRSPEWIELRNDNADGWFSAGNLTMDRWLSGHFTLFRTADLGNKWELISPLNSEPKNKLVPVYKTPRSERLKSGWMVAEGGKIIESEIMWAMEVDPTIRIVASEDKIIVVDALVSFYSNDIGETWTTIQNGNLLGTAAALSEGNDIYISGTFGVRRSTDKGKTWQQFNTGLVNSYIQQVISINGNLYAITYNQFVYSDDGGETWNPITKEDDFLPRIISSNGLLYARTNESDNVKLFNLNKENQLIEIPEMTLLKNSSPIITPPIDIVSHAANIPNIFKSSLPLAFAVSETAFYVTDGTKLYRWNIGALNWYDTGVVGNQNEKPENKDAVVSNTDSFQFAVSDKTVYVGKKNGQLMLSHDEGTLWKDVSKNLPFSIETFKSILFAENVVYVATDKGVVTSKNGSDWKVLTDSEGTPIIMDKLSADGSKVFGLSEQKIYQLILHNSQWQQVTPELESQVTCFDADANMLYVGTNGSGVLRYTLDQ